MVAVDDGRRLRRAQNREAVLDALAELFAEGVLQPTTDEIAERARISPRSLFRYFADMDDLVHATIRRQLDAARPLVDIGATPHDATATKIAGLVETRARLFDAIAPAARAARATAHRRPEVANQVREARSFLRQQVRALFAPELDGRPGLLPALDVLCSFESYDLLRRDQGLSRGKAVDALTAALTELLVDQ